MHISSIVTNVDDYILNEHKILQLFDNPETWRQIPILNHMSIDQLKDQIFVRFRGMIQDMLDPEIYLEKYEVIDITNSRRTRFHNGKYKDCLEAQPNEKINFECHENVHGERRIFFVVSLPGINPWASMIEGLASNRNTKKLSVGEHSKNMEENMKTEDTHKIKGLAMEQPDPRVLTSKLSTNYLVNSPISTRPSKACMVKVYSNFDNYALNSLVDVVGFLSVDSVLDCTTYNCDDFASNVEIQAQNPPPSLVPRLHAVAVRTLNHNNPLLDINICDQQMANLNFTLICKELKIILTQCLFGDELAAEYLLLHLLSMVYIRSEINSIGKFTLNICNLSQNNMPNYINEFYKILELLLPASHYLPMTLETLNNLQFFPKKDYETNKLVSGILQLAPMTHFVLDETQMAPGILDAGGIKAMQNLSHLIKTQQIKCDFTYYEIDYNVDIPVLILSEGKSILPSDFLVPLKPETHCVDVIEETLKAVKYYIQPKLNCIRRYITSGKMSNFCIHKKDSDDIETDFVEMRKRNASIGADELHNLLLLSRLLSISNGEIEFNKTFWERAKNMEELRKARMEDMPKSSKHM